MNSAMEIIKRKYAKERSMMANIRTSLSMINTAVIFVLSSTVLLKLFPGDLMITAVSYLCLSVGTVMGFFSIYYFYRNKRSYKNTRLIPY
jgi:uncharacterized membrane protein YidH (DUF202 family)